MGSMSDLHIETIALARDWQHVVSNILSQPHIGTADLLKPDGPPADEEMWEMMRRVPDIQFNPVSSEDIVAVEFKMFRWQSDWRRRLSDAITHMHDILDAGRFSRGVVVLSIELAEADRLNFAAITGPRVEIWDLVRLSGMAEGDPVLAETLEELASETMLDRSFAVLRPQSGASGRGAEIARGLRTSQPGLAGWRDFESGCEQAVRYLFADELQNPTAQQRTDDGLNRMDLICRIRCDGSSFWTMMAADFSTRYVVFDAKNHANPVGQHEIDITAKYLFRKGLRNFAIIIAREGASDEGRLASAGLLRESGKFILVISLADLCGMLEGADSGDAPENLLYQRMDEMLMGMGR